MNSTVITMTDITNINPPSPARSRLRHLPTDSPDKPSCKKPDYRNDEPITQSYYQTFFKYLEIILGSLSGITVYYPIKITSAVRNILYSPSRLHSKALPRYKALKLCPAFCVRLCNLFRKGPALSAFLAYFLAVLPLLLQNAVKAFIRYIEQVFQILGQSSRSMRLPS